MFENNFEGKKQLVKALSEVYGKCSSFDILNIELKKYQKKNNKNHDEEFIILTWTNGAISTANNNMNSLSATARNIAKMLDGGVYENFDYYKEIMNSEDWEEVF